MTEPQAPTQSTSASTTPERLTWAEIKARYPDEFVCLVDMDALDFKTAVVYAHHPDKRTLREISRHLWSCGLYWTGEMPNFCSLVGRVDRNF